VAVFRGPAGGSSPTRTQGDRDVLTEATAGKRPDYYQQNFQRFCCHQSTALAIAISHPLSRFYFVYSQHAELRVLDIASAAGYPKGPKL